MTVFTAVSIALATSGSTFAALNQLSNLLDDRVKDHKTAAKAAHTFVSETTPDNTRPSRIKADARSRAVDRWFAYWKYSPVAPILALLIFSIWVGVKAVLRLRSGGGEEILADERTFFCAWIWTILIVNVAALLTKLWSWNRVWLNRAKLCESQSSIEDSKGKDSAVGVTPAPPVTAIQVVPRHMPPGGGEPPAA